MKYIVPLILSIGIGVFMAIFVLNQYNNKSKVMTVFNSGELVYFIEVGVYENENEMKSNSSKLLYYIYNIEDNKYHVYVGITKDKNNIKKLEDFFNKKGYSINVKELYIDNDSFIELLSQYDLLVNNVTDDEILNAIENQIINKYKELILDEN